ncbi:MAG: (Fe-S)-binding protein [Candidatus Alcyoniella australis]|nr:(Fe-S)-binding protein [Candidatus Alcyoniella australis]
MSIFKTRRKEIEYCTFCPKMCRFSCPVANATARETHTPWGRMTILHFVNDGKQEFNREVVVNTYKCLTCMLCNTYCEHKIDVPGTMLDARAAAVQMQIIPREVQEYRTSFLEHNNPVGEDLLSRLRGIVPKSLFNAGAQVGYFASCGNIYNYPNVITDTFKVFEALGIDYVAVHDGQIQCSGYTLNVLGLTKDYKLHAQRVADELQKYKTVIAADPSDAYELKFRYKEIGVDLAPQVLHISEFLMPFFEQNKVPIKTPFPKKVIWHDPCYLGRYLGVYEAPRLILQAICREPVGEFSWNREDSYCCGGGGGMPITNPEISMQIARHRLSEVLESEGKTLVSNCPTCERMFQKADPQVDVRDLVSLIARTL